ncbi:hypothetical protein TTHERM_000812729 (macronuclear) [Tetrahymena thermophila SB210]|uniref:Uncharacterized protein n=1 Tax=Tetrahymena thermophila (strain SB210) TaxID=312017 RepID=W7XK64_TETTS|nr:hypothetical protein TTHERM_000812729 [Tetrahymena thermophila SB210]EWS76256.1 hypothetical protein TTHERM_000812729 [Tetrahymena thermophila SB210]|eukprot:XP_012651215.1 hypothetical protein TTHERM_000812729 [Tetrahymena thermophila SB210]
MELLVKIQEASYKIKVESHYLMLLYFLALKTQPRFKDLTSKTKYSLCQQSLRICAFKQKQEVNFQKDLKIFLILKICWFQLQIQVFYNNTLLNLIEKYKSNYMMIAFNLLLCIKIIFGKNQLHLLIS